MLLTFSYLEPSSAKTSEQMMQIRPTMPTTAIPCSRLPPVRLRTLPPFINTPEPMTIPTTIDMAVGNPYLFSIWGLLSLFHRTTVCTQKVYHFITKETSFFL